MISLIKMLNNNTYCFVITALIHESVENYVKRYSRLYLQKLFSLFNKFICRKWPSNNKYYFATKHTQLIA